MSELPTGILGLTDRVRTEIHRHVFDNADREVGGVLVGRRVDERSATVRGSIPALEAVGRAAAVTFTHDAWEKVHAELDRRFPGEQIVGWYHSHPGFGIFLSRDDLFIHESFFSEPWQFAYVIDPIGLDEGEFGWKDGEIVQIETRAIEAPRGFRAPPERAPTEVAPDPYPPPPPPAVSQAGLGTPPERRRASFAALATFLAFGLVLGYLGAAALGVGGKADEQKPTAGTPAGGAAGARDPAAGGEAAEAQGSRGVERPPVYRSQGPIPSKPGEDAKTPTAPATKPTQPGAAPAEAPSSSSGGGMAAPSREYCDDRLEEEKPPPECAEYLFDR